MANAIVTQPAPVGVRYDRWGRLQYHPELHAKQGTPWTTADQKYLIEHYALLGPEQVSLALERTLTTVMTRAYELRKAGVMARPAKIQHQRRLLRPSQ